MTENTFHFTNKEGWNAIRSQPDWRFKPSLPQAKERPVGTYFTDIEPTEENLRTLHKRIRVPKAKQEFVFWFTGRQGLVQLFGGRGRDRHIFFSASDYTVEKPRQRHKANEATPNEVIAFMQKQRTEAGMQTEET